MFPSTKSIVVYATTVTVSEGINLEGGLFGCIRLRGAVWQLPFQQDPL